MDVSDRKREIRSAVRAARAAIEPTRRDELSRAAASLLLSLPELAEARTVLAYCATAEEIDPTPAVEELRAKGVAVAFPRVEGGGELRCCELGAGDELERGPMGILQPPEHSPTLRPEQLDTVIVPGVAYDAAGGRLGYGGGYYDRLLPRLRPDCVLVGFAFDEQLVEEIPILEHDRRVDLIVTPTRVLRSKIPKG